MFGPQSNALTVVKPYNTFKDEFQTYLSAYRKRQKSRKYFMANKKKTSLVTNFLDFSTEYIKVSAYCQILLKYKFQSINPVKTYNSFIDKFQTYLSVYKKSEKSRKNFMPNKKNMLSHQFFRFFYWVYWNFGLLSD